MTLVSDDFPWPLGRHMVCTNGTPNEFDVAVYPSKPFLGQVLRLVVHTFVGTLHSFEFSRGL